MCQEQSDDGVKLQDRTLKHGSHGHAVNDPSLGDPVTHQRSDRQRSGDWKAFKVSGFAGGVLGNIASRDIEASQAREAGEDEAGQEELVEWGAHAEGESAHGGSHTEGDLF